MTTVLQLNTFNLLIWLWNAFSNDHPSKKQNNYLTFENNISGFFSQEKGEPGIFNVYETPGKPSWLPLKIQVIWK